MAVVISLIITVIIVICVLNHRGIMCPVSNSSDSEQITNAPLPPLYYTSLFICVYAVEFVHARLS